MNSGFASLAPDFPRLPVYLLNTIPPPRKLAFARSNKSAFIGSNAALTSLESMEEFARHLLRESSEKPSGRRATTSATAFSKKWLPIPVAPTEPISSLSTQMQQLVRAPQPPSRSARTDAYAHERSSCP